MNDSLTVHHTPDPHPDTSIPDPHQDTFRRLVIFSLFWHFLDLVWIFIFTFVYLMGVII